MYISGTPFDSATLCWTGSSPDAPILQSLPAAPGPIPYLGLGYDGGEAPWGAVEPGVDTVKLIFLGQSSGAETIYYSVTGSKNGKSKEPAMDSLGSGWSVFHYPWIPVGWTPSSRYSVTAVAYDADGDVLGERTVHAP